MAVQVGRITLGVCAGLAVIGGALLTLMVVLYFAASEYVAVLTEIGGWGILTGMAALGIYVGGIVKAPLLARIAVGLPAAFCTYLASMIIAFVVSFLGDPGGERGNLETGTAGFIWLLIGAYLTWRNLTGTWPARRAGLAENS